MTDGYPALRPSQVLPADYVGLVAVDTETSGLFADDGARTSVVSVALLAAELEPDAVDVKTGEGIDYYAFPFDQGPRDKLRVVQQSLFDAADDPNLEQDEWIWLLRWLSDPRRFLVFHNAPFDLEKLRVGTRHWPGVELEQRFYWDTRLACYDLWPLSATSLKPTSVRLWGEGEDDAQGEVKAWLKKHKLTMGDADKVPWDVIGPYAAKDAQQTLRLCVFQQRLYNEGLGDRAALQREFDKAIVTYRITRRGIGFDAAGCLDQADLLEQMAAEMAAKLPFDPNINAAKRYFSKTAGSYLKTTEAGNDSLPSEAVWAMERDGVRFAREWGLYAKYSRALSMWYRGYPEMTGPDGRLRTYFRQAHVRSGRFSVERVNLQAVPKGDKDLPGVIGIRSFVRAAPGHSLWNLDLSQAELRVATVYAGARKMRELLDAGADLHSITTQEVMGVDPNAPDFKFQRDIGKRLTFSSIFQVGPKTFRETLIKQAHIDLPLSQCKAIVYGWRDMYPEFTRAYQQSERQVYDRGFVTLLRDTEYSRRSWFGPRDWPNTGWSRTVQGSLADLVGLWLINTERFLHDQLGLQALVLTVHDSIVLELPDEGAGGLSPQQICDEIARSGAELATRLFEIEMKVDVGSWHK